MFFNRHLIAKFMYFYWTFHFVSTGLAIWFSGLLVFWLIFMPIWRFFETLHIFYYPSVSGEKVLAKTVKALDFSNKITLQERSGYFCVKYVHGEEIFQKHIAICRIAWLLPVTWILLPILYFPLVARGTWQFFNLLTILSNMKVAK